MRRQLPGKFADDRHRLPQLGRDAARLDRGKAGILIAAIYAALFKLFPVSGHTGVRLAS